MRFFLTLLTTFGTMVIGLNAYLSFFEGDFMPMIAFLALAGAAVAFNAYIEDQQKKSYEEEMSVYDERPAAQPVEPRPLSLDDLLTDDGEIPDHLLQGGE